LLLTGGDDLLPVDPFLHLGLQLLNL
jgi:hypothetical protein